MHEKYEKRAYERWRDTSTYREHVKENKKITQSEHDARIRLSVAES